MRTRYAVTIAGSHGKTTTTSLVATVLRAAGLDPTVVVGGKVNALGTNARLGAGDLFVAEADESDGSFLKLTPTIAVVTNIDAEHLDHYGTHDAREGGLRPARQPRALLRPLRRVPRSPAACRRSCPRIERRHVTYGVSRQADYRAKNPSFEGLATHFDAYRRSESLGALRHPHAGRAQRAQRPRRSSPWPTSSRSRSTSPATPSPASTASSAASRWSGSPRCRGTASRAT